MVITWKLCGKVAVSLVPIAAAAVLLASSNPLVIRMQGPCDPATFNAAVGPGTCIGNGPITFPHFVAELTAAQKVGAWLFDPTSGHVAVGTVLSLENRAGETHTFTKVKEFGGGFIPFINTLSGTPVPAPECATATVGGLVPKPESPSNIFVEAETTEVGPTAGSAILPSGITTKFQCCIHPWMKMEVTVK
jgi:hypothetical protein